MRVLFLLLAGAAAVQLKTDARMNPISKIVNVLQNMQKELNEEAERDEKSYEKYFCYCKNGAAKLAQEIAGAGEAAKQLNADIQAGEARVAQLKQEVEDAKQRRKEAKESIAEATAIRKKEKEEFDKAWGDCEENISAMERAITALQKGMGKSFMQTSVNREALRHAVEVSNGLLDVEKEEVFSFISQNPFGDYSAQSGEIVGYLKQMNERMNKDCLDLKASEEDAIKSFKELIAAKTEEVALATAEIEQKIEKAGQVAVETAQKKGQLQENGRALEADKEFLADLGKNCKDQEAAYQERVKARNEEIEAVNEAVRILNDDDARDIFKNTLPSVQASPAGTSFLQQDDSKLQAQELVEAAAEASQMHRPQLSLISYMLRVQKVDFSKVIKMINDMRILLKKEQKDDNKSLAYCQTELKTAADNKAEFERNVKALSTQIEELAARMGELADNIEALVAKLAETKQMMKEATEDRKAENAQFQQDMVVSNASVQLMHKARNILRKIYNPSAHEKATTPALSEEDRLFKASGGDMSTLATQAPQYIAGTKILAIQTKPGPAPETMTYEKKQGSGTGVLQMITNMINDVKKQIKQMEMEESQAQQDYEELMQKSEACVKADTEEKTGSEQALAETNSAKNTAEQNLASKKDELAKEIQTIGALHADCDFLMNNFDTRKEARAQEDDSLSRAVSVLQGATGEDYGNAAPAAEE